MCKRRCAYCSEHADQFVLVLETQVLFCVRCWLMRIAKQKGTKTAPRRCLDTLKVALETDFWDE